MIARFAISVCFVCHLFPRFPILLRMISRLWTTVCRRFFSRTSLSGLPPVHLSGWSFDVPLLWRKCRASQQKRHGVFHYTGTGQFIGARAINPTIDPWLISDSAQVDPRCDASGPRQISSPVIIARALFKRAYLASSKLRCVSFLRNLFCV
jgi:hypothetical protein